MDLEWSSKGPTQNCSFPSNSGNEELLEIKNISKLPHSVAPHTTAASTAKLPTIHLAWQPFSCWELLEWSIT